MLKFYRRRYYYVQLVSKLQAVGKALMLPVAVLPAAALLLRLGAPDVFDIPFITQAGGAVFNNLALILPLVSLLA